MWHMLCERGKDLELTFSDIASDEHAGSAHLEATYTFTQTGRKVHNVLEASFRFKDGKIIEQRDRFNFWKWSGMALGMTGWLLGWTPFLRRKVAANAQKSLDKFIAKHPEYQ
ncbi:MAG: nuclear transport factor 2 family protein [Balneolaceae bacterium]|nr:nuclear transport factor 2 family protein [Balneolaceae bacterium]